MVKHIGKVLGKLYILFCMCHPTYVHSQGFYASPNHCVDQNPSPTASCNEFSYFFDKDTNSTSRVWNMGDAFSSSFTSRAVTFNYFSPGTYTVSLTKNLPTGPITESQTIQVGTYPQQPTFNNQPTTDTTVCGNAITLNPFRGTLVTGNYSYLWYPTLDTTKTIDVSESGCYFVEVTNKASGCKRRASINVSFCLEPPQSGGGAEEWFFGENGSLQVTTPQDTIPRDSLANDGSLLEVETEPLPPQFAEGSANPTSTPNGTAMVYGPSGELAFFTAGGIIYNGQKTPINDANNNPFILNADTSVTQGLVIIPKINCNECPHYQYDVYYIDKDTGILNKITIDLRGNDGNAAVINEPVPLAVNVNGQLAATVDENFTQYTVLVQGENFISIASDSLGTNVVEGNPIPGTTNSYIATFQNFFAIGAETPTTKSVGIYEVDTATGLNTLVLPIPLEDLAGLDNPGEIYGISFSPAGNILYVSFRGDPAAGTVSYLVQIDLNTGNRTIIDSSPTLRFGALKIGPERGNSQDQKVFMAIDGEDYLPYVDSPNLPGTARSIGYTRFNGSINPGIVITGTSGFGLPNTVFAEQNNDGDGISLTYFGTCFGSLTTFQVEDVCSPLRNDFVWIFPDGSREKGDLVYHKFEKTGWNEVKLQVTIYEPSPLAGIVNSQLINGILERTTPACKDSILIDSVFIRPSPIPQIIDTSFFCLKDVNAGIISQDSAILRSNVTGGGNFITYRWTTILGTSIAGGDGPNLPIVAPGPYILETENEYFCLNTDTVVVEDRCLPVVFAPSIFTPNGDSRNDSFKITVRHVKNLEIRIYNRWGERVFYSPEIDPPWDGRVNNFIYSPALYRYHISYDSTDFPNLQDQSHTGIVWVVQ